jgi:hypothetical protein
MEILGLEPRQSDLARGIVILRARAVLDAPTQRALWKELAVAGLTEEADEDDPPRQLLAAPWLPPAEEDLPTQRAALEAAAARYGFDAIWCVKVETAIDGEVWLEMTAEGERAQAEAEADDDDDEDEEDRGEPTRPGFGDVLYTAPDAPVDPPPPWRAEPATLGDPDDADLDGDDELDDDDPDAIPVPLESHWRNGAPPLLRAVPFPLERYPEIIDTYDHESFGIAIKLAGAHLEGEETVINAFFALWLSAYQDERTDEFEPFQRADVLHDRIHRSALMWVEQFTVPATSADQVHFLLWIIERLHDVLPIAWARFDAADEAGRVRAMLDDGDEPFILAGNPLADRFRRHGEEAALAWATGQGAWTRRELAGMLTEIALENDPDDVTTAVVAERLLRRALAFDPGADATGYLAIVLIRQRRIREAITLGEAAPSRDVRLLVVGETAEHVPGEVAATLALLDPETVGHAPAEELAELVSTIARHAPAVLDELLGRLPADPELVPYLYNASFATERALALAILRAVLALPVPAPDAGEARTAVVMAWNNACIHAHALGQFALAVELADGGQPYALENPFIYHSAACAYAAVGDLDRALAQVALAIEHEYEHTEKMETDPDLGPLHADPRFAALFAEWRTRRADLN